MAKKSVVQPTFISEDKDGEKTSRLEMKKGKWEQEPPYIKLYLQDIMYLSDLSGRYVPLLLHLLNLANYADQNNAMCVVLAPAIRENICKDIGWKSVGTFNNAIDDLVKGNLIKRVSRNIIQLNPNLFGKGKWVDVQKLRLEINYESTNNRTFQAVIDDKNYWGRLNKE